MNLLEETLELLHKDPRSMNTIAGETGISFSWLTKFHAGFIENPRIKVIQELHDYLKRKPKLTPEDIRLKRTNRRNIG